jgi:hypothetical protein
MLFRGVGTVCYEKDTETFAYAHTHTHTYTLCGQKKHPNAFVLMG